MLLIEQQAHVMQMKIFTQAVMVNTTMIQDQDML